VTNENSGRDMGEVMDATVTYMKDRTGRSLDEWVQIVLSSGPNPHDLSAVRRWLKNEHGVLLNTRWAIADAAARAAGWKRPKVDEYINQQYSGPKAELRPLFDRLRAALEDLGDDVAVEGRAGYTPFVRRRQFAAVVAATRKRIDVGLRFVTPPPSALIVGSKGPGMGTHKLSLESLEQLTEAVEELLKAAYEQNG